MKPIIRVLTFDLTATLYKFHDPIGKTYCDAAVASGLRNYDNIDKMNLAFRAAYKSALVKYPCYGALSQESSVICERDWWKHVVKSTFASYQEGGCDVPNNDFDFDQIFRKINQHFGTVQAHFIYEDVRPFFSSLRRSHPRLVVGVVTNSPLRSLEDTLPLLDLHRYFDFTVSCVDVQRGKPDPLIFAQALQTANSCYRQRQRQREGQGQQQVDHDNRQQDESAIITAEQCLHVGNDYELDYAGARAAGWQALWLQRQQQQGLGEGSGQGEGQEAKEKGKGQRERRIASIERLEGILTYLE